VGGAHGLGEDRTGGPRQLPSSDGAAVGDQEVAVDTVGAGTGETVIITKGSSARFAANRQQAPLDATIVGIVDVVEVED